jgi:hypothetical protein
VHAVQALRTIVPACVEIDGTKSMLLVSPEGEHVLDQRLPYFQLPGWVRDPFGGTETGDHDGGTTLNGRYLVEEALMFSNCGGVYQGTDTVTGMPVIIKEARPLTNCWSTGERIWDAVGLMRHEYEVLRRLEPLSFVPRVIDLFQEWEHTFLVEERVSGGSLNDYWAGEEVILAPSIRHQDRIERFLPRFKHVAEELIRMVEDVHAHGVLLGDLSAGNVLVEPETLNMWFIDFESAVRVGDDVELMGFSTRWGTPFPGRWLTRVSNDYATGAAGIGLFFERLLRPGPRRFVDLPS